ncbi:MAG TPA: hypothetical protein VGL34_26255 [Steroidobacteraceae bacterium]|jgi:hypothetical protein
MSRIDDEEVLERARVREVTGVFHSHAALQAAVEALLLSGFDRADIDRVADPAAVRQRIGDIYVAAEELADVGRVARKPFFTQDDIGTAVVVGSSLFGCAVALAAGFVILVSGGGEVVTGMVAVILGILAGGAAAVAIAHFLRRERRRGLDSLMEARGLILWVRVHRPDQEELAQHILQKHGARAVRIHEIEIEKRPDEIPLGTLRPDPWLGPERLAKP